MNDNALTVEEKAKLCEYYRVNPKAHAKNLIEHCEKAFEKKPSKQAISRILGEAEKWKAAEPSNKRVRGAHWPDLEKA